MPKETVEPLFYYKLLNS